LISENRDGDFERKKGEMRNIKIFEKTNSFGLA